MVFACYVFFCVAKISLKKSWNCPEFVLIASFTVLPLCTPFNPLVQNYFLPIFFFYLHVPIFNCVNILWLFVRISSLSENLFFFLRIFLNPSYLWESLLMIICENLFLFMIIYENLLAHPLLFTVFMKISMHMNTIN